MSQNAKNHPVQDKVNTRHPRNPPIHMMCWMNFWTALYYGAYLFALTGKGPALLAFCARHPDAARDVVLFCLCGAVGQLFIFLTIKQFGSLTNTLVRDTVSRRRTNLHCPWAGRKRGES
jgi:UDP-galactose transporter B1